MLKKENIFYLIFILTIILIRIEVFFFPLRGIIIHGLRINHFWVGLFLVFTAVLFSKIYNIIRTVLFSVGLGIVADELVFMFIGSRILNNYWSIYSLVGVLIIAMAVFIFRRELTNKLL